MNNQERTIIFLEKIAKQCDDEAVAMLEKCKKADLKDSVDVVVWTTMIMNIHFQARLIIAKAKQRKL